MDIGIIIVNFESGTDLANCLNTIDSLPEHEESIREVVVVDNASADGSCDELPEIDIPLQVDRKRENTGFAHACNRGASLIAQDVSVYLFMNPDVRLKDHSLKAVIGCLESNANVGVVGPQHLEPDGTVRRTCAHHPTVLRMIAQYHGLPAVWPKTGIRMVEFDHEVTQPVDHVMGGCYLIQKDVFEQVGGFDETYFLFYEDVDLSYRVRKAGYEIIHCSESEVVHPSGSGVNELRLALSLEARKVFAQKHFSRAGTALLLLSMATSELALRGIHASLGESMENGFQSVISAYGRAFRRIWTPRQS